MTTSVSRAMPATSVRRLALLCAALGTVASPAIAQQQAREFAVVPTVRLTETITDNARLGQSGNASSDWITQINPSVRFDAKGSRVNGNLSVGVNSSLYGNGSLPNTNQFLLNGSGKLTVWDNYAFVDLLGSVSRQPTYTFRPQGADTVTGTGNLSEVRVFSASPYLKGRFAGTGTVEGRFTMTQTDSDSTFVNRMLTDVWSLNATDPRAMGNLGWAFNYRDSHTESTGRRDIDHKTTRLTGMVAVDPQLTIRLIGGTETNNYSTLANKSTTIYGVGADWNPTPLTKISGTIEDRFFGTGYNVTADHRGSRVAFQGSYGKDVSSTSQSVLGAVSLYDLLMTSYAKLYPNPSERAAFVRKFIDTNFPGAGSTLVGAQSVLSNGFYLDRRLQAGVTFIGARNSLSFILFRSDRNTLTENDFALTEDTTSSSTVRSTGATIALQHKLTSITSANVSFTALRSHTDQTGATGSALDSRSRLITAGLATNLTPKTSASVNVRSNQGSGSSAFSENALYGSILFQF